MSVSCRIVSSSWFTIVDVCEVRVCDEEKNEISWRMVLIRKESYQRLPAAVAVRKPSVSHWLVDIGRWNIKERLDCYSSRLLRDFTLSLPCMVIVVTIQWRLVQSCWFNLLWFYWAFHCGFWWDRLQACRWQWRHHLSCLRYLIDMVGLGKKSFKLEVSKTFGSQPSGKVLSRHLERFSFLTCTVLCINSRTVILCIL